MGAAAVLVAARPDKLGNPRATKRQSTGRPQLKRGRNVMKCVKNSCSKPRVSAHRARRHVPKAQGEQQYDNPFAPVSLTPVAVMRGLGASVGACRMRVIARVRSNMKFASAALQKGELRAGTRSGRLRRLLVAVETSVLRLRCAGRRFWRQGFGFCRPGKRGFP